MLMGHMHKLPLFRLVKKSVRIDTYHEIDFKSLYDEDDVKTDMYVYSLDSMAVVTIGLKSRMYLLMLALPFS